MRSDTYVDVRLRCLEMANERAFDLKSVLPLAEQYQRFCMGLPQVESNVVDIKGRSK